MLLYLTSSQKSGLIDSAAHETLMPSKKLVGKFSLKSSVTKDIRNYTTVKFFLIDTVCVEESGEGFTLTLRSSQMMFSARVIMVPSSREDMSGCIQRLLSTGVVNLITAKTLKDADDELRETLSDEGMQRYVTPTPVPGQPESRREPIPEPETEIIPYRWNAKNIRITVTGAQCRSGVTVTTFNLAAWLAARGAEVAYIEVNTNRHLQLLLNVYEAAPTGEHCTIDGVDCYLTNEPNREYQFVIYDCDVVQTPTSVFREADHRLLCGSVLPYEVLVFHRALEVCGELEVRPVVISVPGEFREYCRELFGDEMEMAEAFHNLSAERTNGRLYKHLVEPYIIGEWRLQLSEYQNRKVTE